MRPQIAIPMPHSTDFEYGERALPQYERAVRLAGGEPVRIPLHETPASLKKVIDGCSGVLLPGSNADVDPARFQQEASPHTAGADLRREAVDDLLLEDAYSHRKPVLCVCFGLQSLNVFRRGSLVQHIPDFLPEETRAKVNHEAGKKVAVAHRVEIDPHSQIAGIIASAEPILRSSGQGRVVLPVNSSHHQAADAIGKGLRVVARCPDDGIVEALEGTSPDHLVLAVQWHPERSLDQDEPSRAIFRALVAAADPK